MKYNTTQDSDPKEQYIPSKLEDPSKRNHGTPFPLTAQTASNIGVLIACSKWRKRCLIYSKHKLSSNQITTLKRLLNNFMYACRTIFQDVPLKDWRPNTRIAEHVFTRGNYFMQIKYRNTLLHLTIIQENMHKMW